MCGILGMYNFKDNKSIIYQTIYKLKKLQNRGRDAYGLLYYSNNKKDTTIIKEEGDINIECIELNINMEKQYNISLGYTRYATSYNNCINDKIFYTQPFLGNNINLGKFYLIHNGNLDKEYLRELYNLKKSKYDHLNDTQILVKIIENLDIDNWKDLLIIILNKICLAFSLIIYELENNTMYILKDKFGLKPLCIAETIEGYCISSENNVLINYDYIKELDNNCIYRINNKTCFTEIYNSKDKLNNRKLCLFEYIYFQNKDTKIYGGISKTIEYEDKYNLNVYKNITIENFRENLGKLLGKTEKINKYKFFNSNNSNNVIVIGAPDTGIPYGVGFAKQLNFSYKQFISKVKNQKRSFILNTNKERIDQIKRKFVIDNNISIKNKIVYFVDDSLVRGNTIKIIINLLKEYKPKEIHIRIGAPKILYPCYYGIDIPTKEELIMNKYTETEFKKHYKINSIRFLELDKYNDIMKELNTNVSKFCTGCFTGKYLKEYDF